MKAAFSLAALASPAVAFRGTIGIGGPMSNMTNKEWQDLFKDANATGTYYFDGYNVSDSFPPKKTVAGWSATIRVANITDDPEDGSIPYPGVDVSVKAPDGMELPKSNYSGWNACVSAWGPERLTSGATSDAQLDDGDCSSFLSDECIRDLKIQASGYYFDGKRCRSFPSIPSSCEKYYEKGGEGFGSSITTNFNSTFNGSTLISHRPQLVGDGEHAMTEEEAYKEAVRGVWTVVINWGNRDPMSYSEGDALQPTLLCLRTRNITEGSEDPNVGARTAAYAPMAMLVSILATVLLVY